jgi:hypothetical protein
VSAERQTIGWKVLWVLMKVYQLFVLVISMVLFVTKPPPVQQIPFVILLLIGVLYIFDLFAEGTANERGITMRRYRDETFVPWREVEKVFWSPKAIRIKLRDRNIFRRYAFFPLKSRLRDGIAFTFGRAVAEPEFIAWLKERGYLPAEAISRERRGLSGM